MAAANPERGEVEFTVGEQSFVLALTTNAICALEKELDKSFGELVMSVATMNHHVLRSFFFHALQRHHKRQFQTREAVGDLFDAAGGFGEVVPAYRALLDLNRKEKEEAEEEPANPPDAQVGTGPGLRLTPKAPGSRKAASGD